MKQALIKQALINLINALKIAQQMPTHSVKARQLRSFFEEVGQLDFPQGEGIVFANSYQDGKYRFCYINSELGIEVEVEAAINDTEQSLSIIKEIFSDDE